MELNIILNSVLAIFIAFSAIAALALVHPIYCVLSLIVCFLLIGVFLLALDIEFFGLLYILIYVGAISVLFIFVVIMLRIPSSSHKEGLRFGLLIGIPLVSCLIVYNSPLGVEITRMTKFIRYDKTHNLYAILENQYSPDAIAHCFYTQYAIVFLLTGLLLLLSIICTILITQSSHYLPLRSKQQYQNQLKIR